MGHALLMNHRLRVSALASFLLAGSLIASSAYADCQEFENERERAACRLAEMHAADARLNQAYQDLLAALGNADRLQLRDQQRAWLESRDSECALVRKGKNNDTWLQSIARDEKKAVCTLQMTTERFASLESQQNGITIQTFEIYPKLPKFAFRVFWNEPDALSQRTTLKRIEVFHPGNSKIIQTLDDLGGMETPDQPSSALEIVDMNFDGYGDLKVFAWSGSGGGNQGFSIWLFDPKTGKFVPSQELSGLTNPTPDPTTREIRTHHNCGGGCSYTAAYQWSKGRLILIREESEEYNAAKREHVRTTRTRKNGRLMITSERWKED